MNPSFKPHAKGVSTRRLPFPRWVDARGPKMSLLLTENQPAGADGVLLYRRVETVGFFPGAKFNLCGRFSL